MKNVRPRAGRQGLTPKTVAYVQAGVMLALVVLSGCAFQQRDVEEQLASPTAINCRTAPGDIRLLRREKADVAQRIVEGATAIYPAGLVVGLVTGTEGTKLQVAIGDYDKQIDARIAEIQAKCGID